MKQQVVYRLKRAKNEITGNLPAAVNFREVAVRNSLILNTSRNKLILISNNRKLSYKLFSTSNESGKKLQVVSNFNVAKNEATSC